MARLTWQNVASPNFSGISDSYRTMSALLGNAAQSGEKMFNIFRDAESGAADRAILQRLAGVTDAASFDPAAIIGADGSNASTQVLKDVPAFMDTLINRDGARLNQRVTTENQDWLKGGRDQYLANGQKINAAQAAAARGDFSLITDPNFASGLRADIYGKLLDDASGLADNSVNRGVKVYDQKRQERSDNIKDQVAAAIQATQVSSFDNDSAGRYIAGRTDWSPEVRAGVMNAFGLNNFSESSAPTGSSSGGGFGGASSFIPSSQGTAGTFNGSPFDVVVGYGKYGNTSKPLTQMTMGEVQQFGKDVLIPNTRNKSELGLGGTGKGSSAVGAFQITQQTMEQYAPKVIGSDWRNQPFSPENQEKIAKALFEERKNGNLKETWQGLTNTTPGAYADVPWEQMKKEIISKESRTQQPGSRNPAIEFAQQVDSASAVNALQNEGINSKFLSTLKDTSSSFEAASAIAKSLGEVDKSDNVDVAALTDLIDKIKSDNNNIPGRPKVNSAQVSAAIMQNLTRSSPNLSSMFTRNNNGDALYRFFGGDYRVSDKFDTRGESVQSALDSIINGQAATDVLSAGMTAESQAVMDNLTATRENLTMQLGRARAYAQIYPSAKPAVQQLENRLNQVMERIDQINKLDAASRKVATPEAPPAPVAKSTTAPSQITSSVLPTRFGSIW